MGRHRRLRCGSHRQERGRDRVSRRHVRGFDHHITDHPFWRMSGLGRKRPCVVVHRPLAAHTQTSRSQRRNHIVWSWGYKQAIDAGNSARLLRNSLSLRDEEQLLVKVGYRFESQYRCDSTVPPHPVRKRRNSDSIAHAWSQVSPSQRVAADRDSRG